MHPYAEGNIAAARREIAKCLKALEAAARAGRDPEAWAHIAMATSHAIVVSAQLDDAMALDEMAVTAGEEAAE